MASHFLIVEPDPVIALDLSEALADCFPDGFVSVFPTLAAAQAAGTEAVLPVTSVISATASDQCLAHFLSLVGFLSQNIVVISDVLQNDPSNLANFVVVPRPFTSSMIADAVASFGVSRI